MLYSTARCQVREKTTPVADADTLPSPKGPIAILPCRPIAGQSRTMENIPLET